MGFFAPTPPPYDPLEWRQAPLAERARQVCRAWALDGYGTPMVVFAAYGLKIALYVGGWAFFCSLAPTLGPVSEVSSWWLEPLAFQKAIVWSMLFEVLGLGCGSGPLTGRYMPPIGGILYFARPGTTKLALFPKLPLIGGNTRGPVDVLLYLALVALLAFAVAAPTVDHRVLLAVVVVTPILGIADRTIFLAARSEHYWTTLVVFAFADNWIAGAKAVQLALWFFAGFSKLNSHFPTVVCVMTSNGPLSRFPRLRKAMYRQFPDDLRPSRLAVWLAHGGTGLELAVPLVLAFAPAGWPLVVGIALMLALHSYIVSNVPMGVPLEWNVMVVYGGFALFWAHPDVTIFDLQSLPMTAFLAFMLVGLPLFGNIAPQRLSFLLSMRYYAGNWPYSVWLFRGDSYRKLDRGLVKSAPWVNDQLELLYDPALAVGLIGKVMGFRLMHLHGRALALLLPKAIDGPLADYEYLDGEVVAGLALGWNFGDGHLHQEQLLRNIQAQCGFEPGELRCIFVEGQPMFDRRLAYRLWDAATGKLDDGTISVADLRAMQPWPETPRTSTR